MAHREIILYLITSYLSLLNESEMTEIRKGELDSDALDGYLGEIDPVYWDGTTDGFEEIFGIVLNPHEKSEVQKIMDFVHSLSEEVLIELEYLDFHSVLQGILGCSDLNELLLKELQENDEPEVLQYKNLKEKLKSNIQEFLDILKELPKKLKGAI